MPDDMLLKRTSFQSPGLLVKAKPALRARPSIASLERNVSPNSRLAPKAAARHSRFFSSAEPMPGPASGRRRKGRIRSSSAGIEGIAGFADDGFNAIDGHDRDHAESVGLADMDEMIELVLRQLADGAEEAVVAGADRQRPEVSLQRLCIARLDEAHRYRLCRCATAVHRNIAGGHRGEAWSLLCSRRFRRRWPASLSGGEPARRPSGPPKRLFGLVGDVAPGQADIVQVAGDQLGELAPARWRSRQTRKVSADPGEKPDP